MAENSTRSGRALGMQLAKLAAPIVFSNLAYTLLGVLDTLFLGRVSTTAVGSIGIASTLFLAFSLLFRGTIQGAMPYVARMFGSNKREAAGKYLQHFAVLSLMVCPIIIFLPWAVRGYFWVLKPPAEVAAYASTYINIRFLELPFSLLNSAIGSFLIGIGNSRTPMWMAWLSVGVNSVANYILIFGKLGLPAMGIAGAAWGTVIAVAAQLVFGIAVVVRHYWLEYDLGSWSLPTKEEIFSMLRVGLPLGITDAVELAAFSVFFTLISRLGTVELAASQIANQITAIAFMPGFAFGQATGSLVGRYLGSKDPEVAQKVGYYGAAMGMTMMGLVGVGFWLFSSSLGRMFTTDLEVLQMTALLLKVMAFYQVFDAANIVFRGALNGAGDTRFTMVAAVSSAILLFIPTVYLLTFTFGLGLVGAWLGCMAYLMSLAGLCFMRFRRGQWKYIRLGVS